MAIPKSQLEAILRSLNAARFDEIVHRVGAAEYLPDKLAPVQRSIWLADWAHETQAQREAVELEVAPEALSWPTSELDRWRAFAVERFGQIPVIGFKGQVRLPIGLDIGTPD